MKKQVDLTEGSIAKGMMQFIVPMLLGQLLQQLYNVADAFIIGNFASNESFAAISSTGSLIFMIVGFFGGIGIGGGVVIARYFGAKDKEAVERAVYANVMFAIIASVVATTAGLLFVPKALVWMGTPDEVMPLSLQYFNIYFGGVTAIVFYNGGMSILRALGDSIHPLYYLAVSSVVNIILDLIFVAGFGWDVAGAGIATVISEIIPAVLCMMQLVKFGKQYTDVSIKKLRWDREMMREIIGQGIPTGIQNSVISIGNTVVQSSINMFGAYCMSGVGAYAKFEGFVFLPITCISMALPTLISQNLGAKKYDRAKKFAKYGIWTAVISAECIGVLFYIFAPYAIRIFVDTPEAIRFGTMHARTTTLFYFLLSFAHCAAGVMRGSGRSTVPMINMLAFWCVVRVIYVTQAIKIWPVYRTVAWCYPLTWGLSCVVFFYFVVFTDWPHYYERPVKKA